VTYAAHYPVGYPTLLAGFYFLFAPLPWVAMLMNAAFGGLAVLASHRVAARGASRLGACLAAGLVALHPALVAYTPALMTEGVVAALLVSMAWVALIARSAHGTWRWMLLGALGLFCGLVTMIRPQSLLLAPLLGIIAASREPDPGWSLESPRLRRQHAQLGISDPQKPRSRRVWLGALVVSILAVLVCLPWTIRNCSRMGRCVFVSANGGWNLLIGSGPGATGSWVPIEVAGLPVECRTQFAEAEKDACFGRAGLSNIYQQPLRWAGLIPRKLGATFDTAAIASGYLRESNPSALTEPAKAVLAVLETAWQRVVVALALGALVRTPGPRFRLRLGLGVLAGLGLFCRAAWPSYLGLVAIAAALGRRLVTHPQACIVAGSVAVTAATHAIFFGADRYAMVSFGVLGALAGCILPPPDTVRNEPGEAVAS
jgi:hypothetical protein